MRIKGLLTILLLLSPATLAQDKESRKKIVMIDTGISMNQANSKALCKDGAKSTVNGLGIHFRKRSDSFGVHGINVFGLIEERLDYTKFCIYSIRAFTGNDHTDMIAYNRALRHLSSLTNVAGVNLSISSNGNLAKSYSSLEYTVLTKVMRSGAHVFVAIGNEGRNLKKSDCHIYPACLKLKPSTDKLHVVIATDHNGHRLISSNWTKDFDTDKQLGYQVGIPTLTGSSQAAAISTGKFFGRVK